MNDLVAWLRARLDEDERVAQAAAAGGQWRYEDAYSVGAWTLYDEHWNIASLATYDMEAYDYAGRMPALRSPSYIDPDANGRHIARHDPARVLAEVEAKRQLILTTGDYEAKIDGEWGCCHGRDQILAGECRDSTVYGQIPQALRLLAVPYADQPGYREEWRPEQPA